MDRESLLLKILEEEYGITTMSGLMSAIDELGYIDISPFCAGNKETNKE